MNIPSITITLPTKENDISKIINLKLKLRPLIYYMKLMYTDLQVIYRLAEYKKEWPYEDFSALKSNILQILDEYEKDRKYFIFDYSHLSIVQDAEMFYSSLCQDFRKTLDFESNLLTQKEIDQFEEEIIESIKRGENIFEKEIEIL